MALEPLPLRVPPRGPPRERAPRGPARAADVDRGPDRRELTPARIGRERIERFTATERVFHWAMVLPYLVLLATGGLLLAARNGWWTPFSVETLARVHRFAGYALPSFVFLAFWGGDKRVLLRNAREALHWRAADLVWLLLAPISLTLGRPHLPRAGKFNAGQKLHLLAQMILVPTFVASGLVMMWRSETLAAWLIHVAGFFVALPLVLGHLFLALVHPDTRRGLPGMFTVLVDAGWARRHHPREYGEEP